MKWINTYLYIFASMILICVVSIAWSAYVAFAFLLRVLMG